MSCTRETLRRLSTVRISLETRSATALHTPQLYRAIGTGPGQRLAHQANAGKRRLQLMVTAETNSDFIVARIAAERAARAISSSA
jgi:hypothetical protein